jgi:L-ascorbate metabolism protein UlaG (beta-lactamase superfamily)
MRITKLGHACLFIEEGEARILIDPGVFSRGYEGLREIDAVLITHQHEDHASLEALAKVRQNTPGVPMYGDEGTVRVMAEKGDIAITAVHAGEEFEVAGVKIAIYGSNHAVIHPAIPGIENVGYMIAGRFFYPGDNFTNPGVPVEVLALPIGAPWLKVSEVIDYVVAVRPKIAIPVHDAVLAMPAMHAGIVGRFTQPQGIEVRVVENGSTVEV